MDALDGVERRHRAGLTAELASRLAGIEELPDGFAFIFPRERPLFLTLAEWVTLERRCCPFLSFELVLEDREAPVSLRLTGRPGVKEFLRLEFSEVLPGRWPA
jgi:hypothetical protein